MKFFILLSFLLILNACNSKDSSKNNDIEKSEDSSVFINMNTSTQQMEEKRSVVESYTCKIENQSINIEAREMSDGSDEGYSKIFINLDQYEIPIENSDSLVSGFSSMEQGHCSKYPILLYQENLAFVVTGKDDRPMPDRLVLNLIDIKKPELVDQIFLGPGNFYFEEKLYIGEAIAKSDILSDTLISDQKAYKVVEDDYIPLFSFSVDTNQKIVKTLDEQKSFEKYQAKDFFKSLDDLKTKIDISKPAYSYFLELAGEKKCVFLTNERNYPKDKNAWICK